MRPAEVLKQLAEMRQTYKDQGFSYNQEQQAQYDKLRQLRMRSLLLLKNGIVSKEDFARRKWKQPLKIPK